MSRNCLLLCRVSTRRFSRDAKRFDSCGEVYACAHVILRTRWCNNFVSDRRGSRRRSRKFSTFRRDFKSILPQVMQQPIKMRENLKCVIHGIVVLISICGTIRIVSLRFAGNSSSGDQPLLRFQRWKQWLTYGPFERNVSHFFGST